MTSTHFPISILLALSIIIQAAAAIMAFRMIGITGRRSAWGFIAAALLLMAVRRVVPLYRLMTDDLSLPPDPLNEVIGLTLSASMAVGIARIAPIFIERKHREEALAERVMLAELSADIGFALAKQDDLRIILNACAEALVRRLDVAFARIWVLNSAENVLELQASAGMYTRVDGTHHRVPVGKFKIGLIAEERKPHITNAVIGDPRVHDQAWAKREGMVAFAGHPLTIEDKLVGVMAMFSRHPLTDITLKALAAVSNAIAVGIERKRSEEALRESAAFQNSLLNAIPIPVFYKDRDGRYRGFNKAYETFFGATREQLIGKTVFDINPPDLAKIYRARDAELFESGGVQHYESQVKNTLGVLRDVIFNKAAFTDSQGNTSGLIGAILDITERKAAEEKMRRLNRELRAISSCNQILMRAEEEQSLLAGICRIVCDEAGYRMAWVGYAENDDARTIRPVARAGAENGYLEQAGLTWADASRGGGPSGIAIRSGESVCIQDFTIDPQTAPWRDSALERGYRSCIALPLKDESKKTFGVLNIYSTEPNAFTADELRLLEELAGDLAFGITVLRARIERMRMERENLAHLLFFEKMDRINRAIQGTNDLERMLSSVLEVVLSIFDCDRTWLFYPCDPDAPSFRVPMEITKPEYPGAGILNVDMPMPPDMARNLRETLESPDPVTYIVGSEKPINKVSAEQFGVKSMMMVALYPKSGKPWAFGLHQCSYPRVWKTEEEKLIQEIGRRLSDALSALLTYRDLQESETKYRRIVDTSNEGIWVLGPDTMTAAVNAGMAEMLGCAGEEMIGRPMTDFMFPEDAADHLNKMENRRNGLSENYERRFRRKDGQAVWTLASATPIFDDEHRPLGSFAMFTDITVRKHAEEALREQERHTQSLLRLSRKLECAQTHDEALNAARDEVRTIIGYQNLWAYLFTEDKRHAKMLVAGGPMTETFLSDEGVLTLTIQGDRMLEEIAEAKHIVVVEDARSDERTDKDIVARLGNRTIVNIPIFLMDKHLGAVGTGSFGDEGVRVPGKSEQEYLGALASHLAVTLDRIDLLTRRRRIEHQLQSSLQEKVVLLKEIHHRVKNNMQVIYSLLNLQAKGVADPDIQVMFEEARNRVYSMALIHEKLYQSKDMAHIDFKEYLQNLVQGIADTYKRHEVVFSVDMESIALDLNVGIPCGLIVNELVSNSLKHAFPEGKKGTIRVGINKDGKGNNLLTVSDNGVGFPDKVDFRNTTSLGLQLVNVLSGQIHGTITLSKKEGTEFSITFPGTAENR